MKTKLFRHGAMPLAVTLLAGFVLVAIPTALEARWESTGALTEMSVSGGGLDFFPNVDNAGARLTVSGGGKTFTRVFGAGERPSIEPFDSEGNRLVDGTYSWELQLLPDAQARRNLMIAASANGGEAPGAWRAQSGSFVIRAGSFESPDVAEAGAARGDSSGSFVASTSSSFTTMSRGNAPDSDAAGGSEAEARAAASQAQAMGVSVSGAGLQMGNPGGSDSDGAAMAVGASLESPLSATAAGSSVVGKVLILQRSVESGSKNGRPETKE